MFSKTRQENAGNGTCQTVKIDGLTSLRAVAALWVALGHFYYQVPVGTGLVESVLRVGGLGVILFFVLSGFILSHTYSRRFLSKPTAKTWQSYAVARFARVYPVHFVTLIAFPLILVPAGIWPVYHYDTVGSFVAALALVHAWGFYPVPTWNQPSWTISVELICYAAFPVLALLTGRLAPSKAAIAAIVIGGGFAAATLIFQTEWLFIFGLFIVKYGACFVLGCLVYRLFETRRGDLGGAATGVLVFVASAGIVIAALGGSRFEGLVPTLFALWIYALAAGAGPVRRLFDSAPFVYLGQVSYSYFLVHEIALLVLLKAAAPFGMASADIPLIVKALVALAFAVPLYHWVEEPARQWIRSRFGVDVKESPARAAAL